MPSTLRRSRRRDLTLTRSFTNAIRDKVCPDHRFRPEARDPRPLLTDRTNVRVCSQVASTSEAGSVHVLDPRPSTAYQLYGSPNPTRPIHLIHRLPPELLVHVFTLGSYDDVMFPIRVSHVCRAWRAVALSAHTLWRRIALAQHFDVEMWQERVRRARACTLDVVIASHPRLALPHDLDVVALQMHVLVPRLAQTRSIDVRFDGYTPYLWNTTLGPLCHLGPHLRDPSLRGSHERRTGILAPRLESLTLRYPQNDDSKEFTLFDGSAPKLVRLTVQGVRLAWLPGLFGGLKYLDYTHHGFTSGQTGVDEILLMLRVCCQLRQLSLCFTCKVMEREMLYIGGWLAANEVVVLPFLESLSLGIASQDASVPTELVCIVSRVSLPVLKQVRLFDLRGTNSCSLYRNREPLEGLGAFYGALGNRITWSRVTEMAVEGRWVEASLLSGLEKCLDSLRMLRVDTAAENIDISVERI